VDGRHDVPHPSLAEDALDPVLAGQKIALGHHYALSIPRPRSRDPALKIAQLSALGAF